MSKIYLIVVTFCLLIVSCQKKTQVSPPGQTRTIPLYDHVVVLILENQAYEKIINSAQAPYINSVANSGAFFTQSYALTHPSQPNYLCLYSGSNQGVTDDVFLTTRFKTPNLGHQLISSGKTFATYSENLPSVGYEGNTYNGYAHKHNPSANWMGAETNQIPPETNQPFTAFPTNFTQLPTISFVVPTQENDMHDGSISTGDTWIKNNLGAYITWAQTHNSLFILTFDEDDNTANNHIPTIFSGQHINRGAYTDKITHFTVLRTLEDMYGLSYAGQASAATSITTCWSK